MQQTPDEAWSNNCSVFTRHKAAADILETNGQVNERDPDIQSWKNEVEASLGDLKPEDRLILKKAKSWSAPGPDAIVNFWWKVFPEAGHALRLVTEDMLNAVIPFPDWLVMDRSILIPKKGEAKDPGNYRPYRVSEHPVQVCHGSAG